MAAANESQGLKIAVAIFVTFTVILAVATYFSYTAYATADAKYVAAEAKANTNSKATLDALTQVEGLRKELGVKAEEFEAIKVEIKAEYKKIDEQVKSTVDSVIAAVTKAQTAGANGPELEDAKAKAQQVAAAYRAEPNKTYISALDRMTALNNNLAMVTTQLSLNYADVKRNLEGTDKVNADKVKVAEDQYKATKDDLLKEHTTHESERQSILARIDTFQSENAKQAVEIQNLQTQLRKLEDDYSKKLALAQANLRNLRDQSEKSDIILDRPDGHLTFVDYRRGEIRVDVTRSMGAKPQMRFAIFDRTSAGVPTDTPKGSIELTSVGDRESVGRIVKTNSTTRPFQTGDVVYSSAWDPNNPLRFALVGKIDLNRDGRDDREDLKRLISAAGGIVDYDLPPPEVGRETGKLTGADAWYVIDDRTPWNQVYGTKKGVSATENTEFLKKQTEAIREARLNGVRPMPVERLMPFLGYDYQAPILGRAEAIDSNAMRRLIAPRPDADKPKPAAEKTEEPAAKDEKP